MTVDKHDFLVGQIVGFHALGGEVKIRPSTNNPALLVDLETVRIDNETLKVRSARVDRKMLLLAFDGHPDRTSVEKFESSKVYCKQDELLPLESDEFWIRDLVGLDVFVKGGDRLGKVVSIIYGGNDILEVQREEDAPGKTILIPFVQDLVPTVDVKSGRIEVIDVPGLLEPQ